VSEDTVAYELIVHGHVQGVFFRDATRRAAERHGVRGWVANLPDGTVEVVLEGRTADVQQVIAYCRHGPREASVTDVDVREREPQGRSGFEVR
jgi:acylphosphatase